ncbi:ATP-dependent endonuclease [Salinibacterium sp. ZJ450]|uniref:ATP-dependent nuclease n=1 Tax=Salinibacterium sp. ZJ450 TaxID=2708338 RepID=UPI001CD19C34|nr:AAA family ATPase [Salinibacterium sp. ZJ450]
MDLALDVRRHLVLVGANDVGKSSLLRCLDLALGASTAGLYSRITPDDFRDRAAELLIEVDLIDFSADEKAHFPDEINQDPRLPQPVLTIRLEAQLDQAETLQVRRYSPKSGNERQLSREQLQTLGWKMIGATQSGARDFRDDRNSSFEDILAAIDLSDERPEFEDAVDGFQNKLNDSIVLGELRAKLATQLSKAVPSRIEADNLRFVSRSIADEDLLADVRLQMIRDGVTRGMAEQSDGARALFAIAMYDLVSEAANVVAVDEPEIHLHPTSQRSLANLLRSSSNQKVIATHSPDIVGAFSPEEIAVVRRGGLVKQAGENFLDGDAKLAARWWVRDKLEPLTSSFVLLVEGPSDRIVVRRVGQLVGNDLDRHGISVVETDGSRSVPNARKVFGPDGFDVPIRMLIDDDAVQDTADAFGVDKGDLSSHGVIVSMPDLEAEYSAAIGGEALWNRLVASGEFKPNQLLLCTASGPGGTYTAEDVAAFCRRKNFKVQAALIVAATLTAAEATAVTSINALLAGITSAD